MSFSSHVKEELTKLSTQELHCNIAELAAMLVYGGIVSTAADQQYFIALHTDNIRVAQRFACLIEAAFHVTVTEEENNLYTVRDNREVLKILKTLGMMNNLGYIEREEDLRFGSILQRTCCQRAFLRGAFLTSGSITDPAKNYHFEIVCDSDDGAIRLRDLLGYFGIEAKIILRKRYYIVYLKEGTLICEALTNMGATIALMEFENVRIVKDVRNNINRQVNCDTANIKKTVHASRKQIDDIIYIRDTVGLQTLPIPLQEIAYVRLDAENATLKELGEMLSPPVGKSGVNHRLRKISSIAEELRLKSL